MTLEKITTEWQKQELWGVMELDAPHWCHRANFIVRQEYGRIVGAFSVECAPVLYFWMHSKEATAMQGLRVYKMAEEEMKRLGHRVIVLPIESASPFRPFVEKLGYAKLGEVELLEKELGEEA